MIKNNLSHVSASQIALFMECRRKWYMAYVMGLKQPPTASLDLGLKLHKEVEHYLEHGKTTGEDVRISTAVIAAASRGHLPKPGPHNIIESELEGFMLGDKYPTPVKGFIDVLDVSGPTVVIEDHKTTSGAKFVYAYTPETLDSNLQLILYAAYVAHVLYDGNLPTDNKDEIIIRHNYFLTQGPADARVMSSQSHRVESRHNINDLKEKIKELNKIVDLMVECSVQSVVDVAPDWGGTESGLPEKTKACWAFGGCHLWEQCSKTVYTGSVNLFNPGNTANPNEDSKMSSLQALIARKKAEADAAPAAPVTPTPQAAPEATTSPFAVLPPDAPASAPPAPVAPVKGSPKTLESLGFTPTIIAGLEERGVTCAVTLMSWYEGHALTGGPEVFEDFARVGKVTAGRAFDVMLDNNLIEAQVEDVDEEFLLPEAPVSPAPAPVAPPVAAPAPAPAPTVAAPAPAPTGFNLFIDCMPVKGVESAYNIEDVVAGLEAEVAREAGTAYAYAPEYRRGQQALAGKLNAIIPTLDGKNIILFTHHPAAGEIQSVLISKANLVVKG